MTHSPILGYGIQQECIQFVMDTLLVNDKLCYQKLSNPDSICEQPQSNMGIFARVAFFFMHSITWVNQLLIWDKAKAPKKKA